MSVVFLALAACAPASGLTPGASGRPVASAEVGAASEDVTVYACDDARVAVRFGPESARLFLPGRSVVLPERVAASGARYASEETTFWTKGSEALLQSGGDTDRNCRIAEASAWEKAQLRGVDVRATGYEPGWYLEIERGERILVVADYGETRAVMPAPPPAIGPSGATVYRSEGEVHALTVRLEDHPCHAASGEALPLTVTMELDGRRYHGCGRRLG